MKTISDLMAEGYRVYRDKNDQKWRWDRLQGPQSDWLTSPPFENEYLAIKNLREWTEAFKAY